MNWMPNQFRLLISSVAHVLMDAIRSFSLKGTHLLSSFSILMQYAG
jgi:hypothetical protein